MEQQNEELGEESAESEEGRGIRQFDAGEEPAQLIIDTEQNVEQEQLIEGENHKDEEEKEEPDEQAVEMKP